MFVRSRGTALGLALMTREQARQLRCGDTVLFTGTIYTARDAAHKRLVELLDKAIV